MSVIYDVRVFNSIDSVEKELLDSFSNDPFFTYGWFKTLEQQTDFSVTPFYIAVYFQDKLIAFTPCFLDFLNQYFTYTPAMVPFMKETLNFGKKVGFWKKNVLLCYSPFCFRSKIIIDKNFNDVDIFKVIYQKINEICKNERILFSAFLFVSEYDFLLAQSLHDFGYFRFPWSNTLYLDIEWPNFEVFLKSLSYKRRKDIRRQIRKFNENSLTLNENLNINIGSENLSILHSNVFKKYRATCSPLGASFFNSLKKYAGDKVKIFAAQHENETIAYSLVLTHKNVADAFVFGTNYDSRTKNDFAYFNLSYYEPIKWAIKNDFKKIFYRLAAENVKLNAGCKIEKNFSFIKCHNRLMWPLVNFYVHRKYDV